MLEAWSVPLYALRHVVTEPSLAPFYKGYTITEQGWEEFRSQVSLD